MPDSIFGYIFKHSMRQQVIALVGTLLYLPILYLSFEVPKIIVNDALDADPQGFPREVLGATFEHLPYLFLLCGVLLGLVVLAGGLRYVLSVYKGVLGEVMLRRLRYDLYTQILRFPFPHLKKVQGGEIVTMTTAEVEPLGRYMGVAVANPALQGGTLITALVFLFAQDWLLGLAAVALFPVQGFIVPKFQQKMNALSRQRIANLRQFAGHVGESIEGLREIHAHDTSAFELTRTAHRLGILFRIRRELYKVGNGIIFLNSFFTQLTPFFFYVIGGWLVISGDLTLGALVAVIAAYREAAAPWNELLENYQALEDNKVKYAALVENFQPDGLKDLPDCDRREVPAPCPRFGGTLTLDGIGLKDGDEMLLEGVSLAASMPCRIAVLGPAGSGKAELAEIMAGLRRPTSGRVACDGYTWNDLSPVDTGRALGYVDQDSHIFSGSWRDNLLYGLKHRPTREPDYDALMRSERRIWEREARLAGNTANDLDADWIDYTGTGISDEAMLTAELLEAIRTVGLEDDLFDIGLNRAIDPAKDADTAECILKARRLLAQRLADSDLSDAVMPFAADAFNTNATLAENFLFGRPTDQTLSVYHLGDSTYVIEVLRRHGLLDKLIEIGHLTAKTVVELFRDLDPGDERLQRFSLIDKDYMPVYESLLRRVPHANSGKISDHDRTLLLSLAFTLAPAHQRLGLIDEDLQTRLVAARIDFNANLPAALKPGLDPFAADRVNAGVTVRCNVLYGRIARARAQHRNDVNDIVAQAITEVGLRETVLELGLGADVGTGGGRLTAGQRQRLAFARVLVKKPQVLIINEALGAIDPAEQDQIRRQAMAKAPDTTLVWFDRERDLGDDFDQVLVLRGGRVVEQRQAGIPTDDEAGEAGDTLADEMAILDGIPLLEGVSPSTLKLLAFTAERREFDSGETLFCEGEDGESAYIVLEGGAEASLGRGPSRVVLGQIPSGTVVGEVSLLSDVGRTATVTATSPLKALHLSRNLFLDIVGKDPALALSVLKAVSGRLAATTAQLEAQREPA